MLSLQLNSNSKQFHADESDNSYHLNDRVRKFDNQSDSHMNSATLEPLKFVPVSDHHL